MPDDFSSIPVKDFAHLGIKPRITCSACGRSRVDHGGIIPRTFSPETRLHQPQLDTFAKRFVCSECGARGAARVELVVDR